METKINLSFPLYTVILPYYSGYWAEWEFLLKNLNHKSYQIWKRDQQALENLLKLTKFHEVHISRKGFDEKFARYIDRAIDDKRKNTKFEVILDSISSYNTFVDYFKSTQNPEYIKRIYLINAMDMTINEYLVSICQILESNNLPLSVISMKIPKDIEYRKGSSRLGVYSYNYYQAPQAQEVEDIIPYIDVVKKNNVASITKNCRILLFQMSMLPYLFEGSTLLVADSLCMKAYDIENMIKQKEDFPETLKTNLRRFILYNNEEKFFYDGSPEESIIPYGSFKKFWLATQYAEENFPNLKVVEFSLLGFSPAKLNQILNSECKVQLNVDLYDTDHTSRNKISMNKGYFFYKSKKQSTITAVAYDSLEVEYEEGYLYYKNINSIVFVHSEAAGPTKPAVNPLKRLYMKNARVISDITTISFTSELDALYDNLTLMEEDFVCGFMLLTLQVLELNDVTSYSVLPKQCVHSKIRIKISEDYHILSCAEYLQYLGSTAVCLELYQVSEESKEAKNHINDPEIQKTLRSLNVLTLSLTNFKDQENLSRLFDLLENTSKQWFSLQNIFTKFRYRTGKSKSVKASIIEEIPDILVKNSVEIEAEEGTHEE
ncbi:unnamed protein product [Moneuplotes crassus]|uniref:Uncharacterized protein n=1 Tax=Euplotes crassus TaxID=5936 RepID=A0AAD1Y476_EUPCR|nr:unnamed protein product [Moneuplotes crassus]